MSSKTVGVDANKNNVILTQKDPVCYSLENVKLNRQCPLQDSVLKSNITSLRIDIPSSNDPIYANEVLDKIGSCVKTLYLIKVADKEHDTEYPQMKNRVIPSNILTHFPLLEELHLKYTNDFGNFEYLPPNLKRLNIRYFYNCPIEEALENYQKIPELKVDEISLSDDSEQEKNFVKMDDLLSEELKKLFQTKRDGLSIRTEINLVEQKVLQIQDVTGIIIDSIDEWTFDTFDGLQKFTNLQSIRINFSPGHKESCLFPHSNFSCPSVKDLHLVNEHFCDTCFTNLIEICPNVTSLILEGTFDINSVHKVLQNKYVLETFLCKSYRCMEKLDNSRMANLETLETTLDWNEVENWPEMPSLKKLTVGVRPETKIVPLAQFLKKCPNLTSLKISSFLAGREVVLYAVTQIIANTLKSLEFLRIKIYDPVSFALLKPLVGCSCLKVLHLVTFPNHSNFPFHDRTETLTFQTELILFDKIPTLDLLMVHTEYGRRRFYRGDLYDLRSYLKNNILRYREPQHIVKYVRESLMSKDETFLSKNKQINPLESEDFSDVDDYLGVEVKHRSMLTSLEKNFKKLCGMDEESDEEESPTGSIDSLYMYGEDMTSDSDDYLLLDGNFTDSSDSSDDFSSSEECAVD